MNYQLPNGNYIDARYGGREYARFFGGQTEEALYADGSFYQEMKDGIESTLGIELSTNGDRTEPDIWVRHCGTYYDIWIEVGIYERFLSAEQANDSTFSGSVTEFVCDWAFIVVDVKTGFATVRDIWDGLVMNVLDSLDEAIEYCCK